MAVFTVAAHTAGHNDGFIRYNTETKELQLMLHDEEKEFLTKVHPWHRYVTLSQYETVNAAATDNLETLKLALGYIWLPLGVHIDWSRPVEDM